MDKQKHNSNFAVFPQLLSLKYNDSTNLFKIEILNVFTLVSDV